MSLVYRNGKFTTGSNIDDPRWATMECIHERMEASNTINTIIKHWRTFGPVLTIGFTSKHVNTYRKPASETHTIIIATRLSTIVNRLSLGQWISQQIYFYASGSSSGVAAGTHNWNPEWLSTMVGHHAHLQTAAASQTTEQFLLCPFGCDVTHFAGP